MHFKAFLLFFYAHYAMAEPIMSCVMPDGSINPSSGPCKDARALPIPDGQAGTAVRFVYDLIISS